MTPDVNLLVAASRTDHPAHEPAVAWLRAALADCTQGSSFCLLPMVAVGFVRIVTNRRVFHQPTPIESAVTFLRSLLAVEGVQWAVLGTEFDTFFSQCEALQLAGNDVQDAWIAAAVQSRNERLVTFDEDFERLLPNRNLTVLKA